ncbi:MAG: aliphatic sulfonate ABC transporter substrate-binding protein [Polyangiaceae bacterium]
MLTFDDDASPTSPIRARALVFEDVQSRALAERIERIARADTSVLIAGETGTGKELVARQVHALSRRARGPFVAINVGALSETLIESELFGHEKGAFTGALSSKPGFFEAAHGGTLFLDEIGELALPLQVKLLRVLQERQVTRLGERSPRPVDVRVLCATHVDLQAALRERRFREDLYFRLRVSTLTLPPLRSRPGDILPLARHFLALHGQRTGRAAPRLSNGAEQRLLAHPWPGNIRELENAIEHALALCATPELRADDLELESATPACTLARLSVPRETPADALSETFADLLKRGVPQLYDQVERALFGAAFRHTGFNQLETARVLGVSRNVVRARLIEHGALPGPLRRSSPPPPRALRIGYQKLGLLMLLARSGELDAALRSEGVSVEWKPYAGGIQMVAALKAGELDLAGLGNCPAVVAQAERVPIAYVAAEPAAPHAAALLVPSHSKVRAVSELRGRRIAVNRAAQAHYVLMLALEEAGLSERDVELSFETPERAWSAFRAGELDAWAIWDPYLSAARLELGARSLRDAGGTPNSTYYVASRRFADESPEILHEAVRQLRATAAFAQRDGEGVARRLALELGFSEAALLASWQRELAALPVDGHFLAAQQSVADTLHRLNFIAQPVSVAEAAWPHQLSA